MGMLLRAEIQAVDKIRNFTILSLPAKTFERLKLELAKGGTPMKRYGSVLRLKPGAYEEYKRLHAAVWPIVLDMIRKCNIRNYSIYHKDGWLFSYFEYVGGDFAADMKKMADDPETQRWWTFCMPLQEPLATRKEGEWWSDMEELFHTD